MVFCNGCCRVKDNRKEVLQSSFLATTSTHWWIFRYLTYVYIWDVSLVFLRAARVIIRQLLNKMHTHLGISISLHSVLQGIGSSLKKLTHSFLPGPPPTKKKKKNDICQTLFLLRFKVVLSLWRFIQWRAVFTSK